MTRIADLEKKARIERESGTWRGSLVYERKIAALRESQDAIQRQTNRRTTPTANRPATSTTEGEVEGS